MDERLGLLKDLKLSFFKNEQKTYDLKSFIRTEIKQ